MSIFSSIGRIVGGGPATTNSETSQTRTPYAGVQSQLDDYIKSLSGVYANPQISGYEQKGYDALQSAAGSSSAALDPAIAENSKTLSGAYLTPDSNPYLKAIGDRIGGEAMAGVNSTFGGGGRTGSGLHQLSVGRGIGDALAGLYGGAYESERGRMSGAVGMAPGLSASTLVAPQALISAGQGISARPFDVNAQLGGILSQISGLGGTTTGTGTTTGRAESPGIVGNLINKLFQ